MISILKSILSLLKPGSTEDGRNASEWKESVSSSTSSSSESLDAGGMNKDIEPTKVKLQWDTLEEASALGYLEKVKELFERMTNTWGQVPAFRQHAQDSLALALYEAVLHDHLPVVTYLLEQGASISDREIRAAAGLRSFDMLELFLKHGWDVNSDDDGHPPICWPVFYLNEILLRWLLKNGADPNRKTVRGFTVLEKATYHAPLDIVRLLVESGADVRHTAVLHPAATDSLQQFGKVHPGRIEVMEYLLEHDADIDLIEPWEGGRKPFINAWSGTALLRAVQSEDVDKVMFLLGKGADKNIKGMKGYTPLEMAEGHRLHEIAEILRNHK